LINKTFKDEITFFILLRPRRENSAARYIDSSAERTDRLS